MGNKRPRVVSHDNVVPLCPDLEERECRVARQYNVSQILGLTTHPVDVRSVLDGAYFYASLLAQDSQEFVGKHIVLLPTYVLVSNPIALHIELEPTMLSRFLPNHGEILALKLHENVTIRFSYHGLSTTLPSL